jgi:choline dehydrogenase-like flavoprotein
VYGFGPSHGGILAVKRLFGGKSRDMLDDLGVVLRNLDGMAIAAARRALFGDGPPVVSLTLRSTSELLSNPESRLVLGDDRDALGQRRAVLYWRKQPIDKRHARESHRLLGAEIGQAGFGRLQLALDDSDDRWPEGTYGDEHMLGTTRMHRDPRRGVVDANCKMHGLENLYVSGSSVFPTCGTSNPTLTIVALALRLADHLKERLQ